MLEFRSQSIAGNFPPSQELWNTPSQVCSVAACGWAYRYPFGSRKSTLLGQGKVPRCQWPGSLALGIRGMTVVNNQMPMSMLGGGGEVPRDQWIRLNDDCLVHRELSPPPPPPPPRAAQCLDSMGQGSSFHTFHLCL